MMVRCGPSCSWLSSVFRSDHDGAATYPAIFCRGVGPPGGCRGCAASSRDSNASRRRRIVAFEMRNCRLGRDALLLQFLVRKRRMLADHGLVHCNHHPRRLPSQIEQVRRTMTGRQAEIRANDWNCRPSSALFRQDDAAMLLLLLLPFHQEHGEDEDGDQLPVVILRHAGWQRRVASP